MALNRSQTAAGVLGSMAPDLPTMESNVANALRPKKPRPQTVGQEMRQTRRDVDWFNRQMKRQTRQTKRVARTPAPGQVTGNV